MRIDLRVAGALLVTASWRVTPGTETRVARASDGSADTSDGDGAFTLRTPESDMVKIPGGTFRMGSTGEEMVAAHALCAREPFGHRCRTLAFAPEGPLRTVRLSPYWVDRREVSVQDYSRCVEVGGCSPIPYAHGAERYSRPELPVTLVTWDEAAQYCHFRSARLPTEAEFERAARGRSGRTFPWGNVYHSKLSNHGRFGWQRFDAKDGFAELAPLASFPSGDTPEGVADLAGNVAEWVQDRYLPEYDPNDVDDPRGPPPTQGSQRSVRGGSFESAAPWLRGASRDFEERNARKPTLGFRCARSAADARSHS